MASQAKSPINVLILALVAYNPETVIPAIELAADESNALYGPNIHFEHRIFLNPNTDICDDFESITTEVVADYYYRNVSQQTYLILLPTGCSYAMINAGELSREWNIPMIASAGSDTKLRNKKRYPTLVCFLPSQIVEYPRTFKRTLDRYQWHTVTFICDPASSTDFYFRTACREFTGILRQDGKNYTVYDFVANLSLESARVAALRRAQALSRVIVILAHMDLVRLTLIAASDMRMTTTDYVFITSLLYNFNTPFWGDPHWYRNDSAQQNMIAKAAFESLLVVTMAKPRRNDNLRRFMDVIANMSLETFHSTAALAEEKQIYSICGHTAFRAAAEMINETIVTGRNLSDGTAVARRMYNRNFDSVEGNPYKINSNGDRDSLCSVVAVTSHTDELEEVLFYDAHDQRMYQSPEHFVWVRETTIAADRPFCGYSGEGCRPGNLYAQPLMIAIPLLAVLLLTSVLIVTVMTMRKKRKIDMQQWLLSEDCLLVRSAGNFSGFRSAMFDPMESMFWIKRF